MFGLQGWHLLIVLLVVLLLFGAARLPQLARSVGQSMKIFRAEVRGREGDGAEDAASGEVPAPDATGR